MINNVFIWGSKSYALLVDDIVKRIKKDINLKYIKPKNNKYKTAFIFDPYSKKARYNLEGYFFNNLSNFNKNIKKCKSFVVCIGENHGKARYSISVFLEKYGLKPLTLISKYTHIGNKTRIGKGVVAMPNSYVNSFSEIGDYSILNSSSNIEHECRIGKGTHIMSGACVGGRCVIEDFATIGTNATILPNIKIGSGSYIGAGSVVTKDVKKNTIIIGVPGKYYKKINNTVDHQIFKKILRIKQNG